jgi:hypothetical protein
MHAFLGATDQDHAENLATLKSWLREGAWSLNRWEARGNVPAITKEQLDKIKAKYRAAADGGIAPARGCCCLLRRKLRASRASVMFAIHARVFRP